MRGKGEEFLNYCLQLKTAFLNMVQRMLLNSILWIFEKIFSIFCNFLSCCELIAGTFPVSIPANTLFIVESKITSVDKESKLPIKDCPFYEKFSSFLNQLTEDSRNFLSHCFRKIFAKNKT